MTNETVYFANGFQRITLILGHINNNQCTHLLAGSLAYKKCQ